MPMASLLFLQGEMEIPTSHSIVNQGDRLLVITSKDNVARVEAFIGKQIEMEQKVLNIFSNTIISILLQTLHQKDMNSFIGTL